MKKLASKLHISNKNVHKKDIGLYNRVEKEICAQKKKNLSLIQKKVRESEKIHSGADEKRIHLPIKVITNGISILCGKER